LVTGHKQGTVAFSRAHHYQDQLKTPISPVAVKSIPNDILMLRFTSHGLYSACLFEILFLPLSEL